MCFERSIRHSILDEMLEETFGVSGWKQLPDEVYKRVRVQPAVYTVEEHHVEVYAGKDNQTILKADRPKSLLRNSIVTPSLAASIMNVKYVNGMPIYRISQEFIWNDIHISKQVMANWMIQCGERYFAILYDYLHEILCSYHVIQADETTCNMAKDGRPANSKSYMWVYRTGKTDKDRQIILYDYERTRRAEHPQEFLKVFLNDPEVPMDNNETEASLRNFCLHKHAWKVIDTIEGAKASAIIYSITETIKANGAKSFPVYGIPADGIDGTSG